MQTILPPKDSFSLHENSQELKVRFAFVKAVPDTDTWQQLHPYVKCRDYLGDVIYCNEYKTSFLQYGFQADYQRQPIDQDFCTMALEFATTIARNRFIVNLRHVHAIEESNAIHPTVALPVGEKECIVIGDKFWQSKIFCISLYSYLLKLCALKLAKTIPLLDQHAKYTPTEKNYYSRISGKLPEVIGRLRELVEDTGNTAGQNGTVEKYNVHDSSGFVQVLQFYAHYSNNLIAAKLREGFSQAQGATA